MNDAKPLIVCHGTGTGQLTVGNDVIDLADSEIVLDSENMQAYYDGTNMNNQMAGEFPVLSPGSTGISWSGGISSVEDVLKEQSEKQANNQEGGSDA